MALKTKGWQLGALVLVITMGLGIGGLLPVAQAASSAHQLLVAGVPPGLSAAGAGSGDARGSAQKVAGEGASRDRSDQGPDSVSEGENIQRSRKFLGFGPAVFANINSPGVGYSLALGYSWDQTRVSIRGQIEGNVRGNALFPFVAVGAHYFFMGGDLSPYVGGDLGLGFVKVADADFLSGEVRFGFVVTGEVGAQILRTSPVGLGIGLRFSSLLNSTSFGIPFGGVLRLSLLL